MRNTQVSHPTQRDADRGGHRLPTVRAEAGDLVDVTAGPAAGAHGDRPPTAADIAVYAAALRRAVIQGSAPRVLHGAFGADDIAQEVVLAFLERPLAVMATYREPRIYARVSMASRSVDLGRRDRTQRGEGSRLIAAADGRRPRRLAISLDASSTDADLVASLVAADRPDRVGDEATDRVLAQRLLDALDACDRWLIECVDLHRCSVTEIARTLGQSRETVSRRVSAVHRSMRRHVMERASAASACEVVP